MKMDRRHFLSRTGKGVAVLALGGLEGMLSGCISTSPRINNLELKARRDSTVSSVDDPYNYLRFLREDEYVVPDKVFEAYAKTVDKMAGEWYDPAGGYLKVNHIDIREEKKEFIKRLQELNLSESDIATYYKLFTKKDVIIFKESVLKDKSFEKVMPHERFHKEMKKLSNKDYRYMINVARELIDRREAMTNAYFPEVAPYEVLSAAIDYIPNEVHTVAVKNPEELFAWHAYGKFIPKVEETLKKRYPKAYKIFDRIREECRLREK